jgi:transcriptional regulator with XRE-family HTH domain
VEVIRLITDEAMRTWHGQLVKQLREKKGMKQGELAAAMGMSKQWAHNFECGFIDLRISVALRFSQILDVSPGIFLPETSRKMGN